MEITEIIEQNRTLIDAVIDAERRTANRPAPPCGRPPHKLNDNDRREWILNFEPLYLWARQKGAKI